MGQFLEIRDHTYHDLTLEFLNSWISPDPAKVGPTLGGVVVVVVVVLHVEITSGPHCQEIDTFPSI